MNCLKFLAVFSKLSVLNLLGKHHFMEPLYRYDARDISKGDKKRGSKNGEIHCKSCKLTILHNFYFVYLSLGDSANGLL